MHTDTLTPEFVAFVVFLLLVVLLLFPTIDFVSSWRARRERRSKPTIGIDELEN